VIQYFRELAKLRAGNEQRRQQLEDLTAECERLEQLIEQFDDLLKMDQW
jgi:hypothetical protein